eukprot:6940112-Pyramimonas_sp.AAC.1
MDALGSQGWTSCRRFLVVELLLHPRPIASFCKGPGRAARFPGPAAPLRGGRPQEWRAALATTHPWPGPAWAPGAVCRPSLVEAGRLQAHHPRPPPPPPPPFPPPP